MKVDRLEPVNGKIRRSDDTVVNMGDTYKVNGGGDVSQQGIDILHHKAHIKRFYTISKTFVAVANDGYADIHIKAVGRYAHFQIFTNCEAKAYLTTFVNTQYSNQDTAMTAFNRHSGAAAEDAATTLAWHTPTISVLGSQRGDDMIPGSSVGVAQQAGGSTGERMESILVDDKDVLIRVQNKGGQAKDINIIISFYEVG